MSFVLMANVISLTTCLELVCGSGILAAVKGCGDTAITLCHGAYYAATTAVITRDLDGEKRTEQVRPCQHKSELWSPR